MFAKLLSHHHTPMTTVNELWQLVEAAWANVSVHAIKSLYDLMTNLLQLLLLLEMVVLGSDFSELLLPNCLKI